MWEFTIIHYNAFTLPYIVEFYKCLFYVGIYTSELPDLRIKKKKMF